MFGDMVHALVCLHKQCTDINAHAQALISGLNRRLEQLSNDASKARDTGTRHGQRAATLEGQLELLRNDNQRLSHDCTEHSSARWRLTAERDTQQRLNAQQHEEDARERERLHGQLSELQRELAESQTKLAEERSMHLHSSASVQTVQDAADVRYATGHVLMLSCCHLQLICQASSQ